MSERRRRGTQGRAESAAPSAPRKSAEGRGTIALSTSWRAVVYDFRVKKHRSVETAASGDGPEGDMDEQA